MLLYWGIGGWFPCNSDVPGRGKAEAWAETGETLFATGDCTWPYFIVLGLGLGGDNGAPTPVPAAPLAP